MSNKVDALKYVLVAVAAAVMLSIVAHSWFVGGTTPSKTLIGAVLVLVLAPVASNVKVFNLIDFRKSVDRIDGELANARDEIATVSNNLHALQLSVASQTVNVNFGESMNPSLIEERSKAESEEVLQEQDEQHPFVLSPAFRLRWFLVKKLNVTLGEIASFLLTYYIHNEVRANRREPHQSGDMLDLTLSDLITYFQGHNGLRDGQIDEEDMDYLRRLDVLAAKTSSFDNEATLMLSDRDQLLDQSNAGPDAEEIRSVLRESQMLRAYFLGSASGLVAGSVRF